MSWQQWGGSATAAANQPLYFSLWFNGNYFGGPIVVAPNFDSGEDNFGQITVGDISVEAVGGNPAEPNAYYPVSFTYHCVITNNSPWPVKYSPAVSAVGEF